jgi:tRNA1(Val) A37 N6-methylase TrmN6
MGFAGGTVLEPGCGTGLFLALMPAPIAAKTAVTAIEMDPSTARIAKLLYPEAWVRQEDFTKAKIGETFDLTIGNPPFSDRTVRSGDPSGKLGLSLHEYFMARSIERLKPGGLARPERLDLSGSGARHRDRAVPYVRLPNDRLCEKSDPS